MRPKRLHRPLVGGCSKSTKPAFLLLLQTDLFEKVRLTPRFPNVWNVRVRHQPHLVTDFVVQMSSHSFFSELKEAELLSQSHQGVVASPANRDQLECFTVRIHSCRNMRGQFRIKQIRDLPLMGQLRGSGHVHVTQETTPR